MHHVTIRKVDIITSVKGQQFYRIECTNNIKDYILTSPGTESPTHIMHRARAIQWLLSTGCETIGLDMVGREVHVEVVQTPVDSMQVQKVLACSYDCERDGLRTSEGD